MKMKESKTNSKLEKLEEQQYLKSLDVKKAKTVFRYRTRMALFSANYKGQGPIELCPLCGSHSDYQEMSFRCPKVQEKIEMDEEYGNIFKSTISKDWASMLQKIENLRSKEDKNLTRGPSSAQDLSSTRPWWVLQAVCIVNFFMYC